MFYIIVAPSLTLTIEQNSINNSYNYLTQLGFKPYSKVNNNLYSNRISAHKTRAQLLDGKHWTISLFQSAIIDPIHFLSKLDILNLQSWSTQEFHQAIGHHKVEFMDKTTIIWTQLFHLWIKWPSSLYHFKTQFTLSITMVLKTTILWTNCPWDSTLWRHNVSHGIPEELFTWYKTQPVWVLLTSTHYYKMTHSLPQFHYNLRYHGFLT